MDVARTALRNGSTDVNIMYREDPESIEAEPIEVEYAKIDGVKFEVFTAPIEIVDEGVKYVRTEVVKDDSGNKKIEYLESTEGIFKADSVILAIGQGPRSNIVSNTIGININGVGLVEVDQFGRTSRKGVFASGDVVTGAKTVVEAVRVSKLVAQAIDEYVCSIEE